MMLVAGVLALTSCEKDMDSNPTLLTPGSLVLNQPELGAPVDLVSAESYTTLTWSQPEWATDKAPVVADYKVEIGLDEGFADSFVYGEPTTEFSMPLDPQKLNGLIQTFCGWESEADAPENMQLYARVSGEVSNAGMDVVSRVVSNTVKLSVAPGFVILTAADPVLWWLIGGDICDGTWGSDCPKSVIPMEAIEGEEYDMATGLGKIHWVGYLAGNGFKLRGDMNDGWATQWGGEIGNFVKNDGGSSDIKVPAAGVYEVVLDTKNDVLEVNAYTGSAPVFSGMAISGSFNGWTDTDMAPVHTAVAENHDWTITTTLAAGDELKFKQSGSWDYNKGGSFVERTDGYYGFGVGNGDNLVIPADGKYLILFNDITGHYRFIKQ